MEVIAVFISTRKLINRGFLLGPYCPIYGWCALIVILFLFTYDKDPLNLYISFVLYASILEYFTSYIMEKLFGFRWWDYSNEKFNLNGRISLFTSLLFGILCIVFVYFTGPILFRFLKHFSNQTLMMTALVIFIIFVTDNLITFKIVKKFKKNVNSIDKDITEDRNKQIIKYLEHNHIVRAFPNVKNFVSNLLK